MKESEYKTELRRVLDENSRTAITALNGAFKIIPEKAQSIELMIFPDQDGEGTFGVRISLTGPDHYVLNKAINECAEIIDVKHSPTGLIPKVPLIDPFDSDFEVNDVMVDTVAGWLEAIWKESENLGFTIPVSIYAEEDYGTILPIKLN